MNQLDKSLDYLNKSLSVANVINDKGTRMVNLIEMAKVYKQLKNYSKALVTGMEGLNIAKEINDVENIQEGHLILSEVFREKKDFEKAYNHYKDYETLKDSVSNIQKVMQISEIQVKYESAEKERQIQMLGNKNKIQLAQAKMESNIRWGLIILLVIIALFAVVFFYLFRGQRKANHALLISKIEIDEQQAQIKNQKEELELKNKKLTELNEEKDFLIGIVAHDLRSPLNQVKGLMTLIMMDCNNLSPEQLQYMSLAQDSVNRLNAMINQILDTKALESQSINLRTELINMAETVDQISNQFKDIALKKNIEIHTLLNSGNYSVSVDKNYMTQVLENLISNAIKFSPSNKNIYIKVEENGGRVRTEIADQGPGFSEKDMKSLFLSYQKLSAKPTDGEKSTGLGLSIVKKYVEAMSGEVKCESVPGKGATFILDFQKVDA